MQTEDGYQNLDILGSGRFGVVKKVMCVRSQKLFACKVIRFRPGEISREDAEREYSILSRLNHPNIVKYVDYRWRPDKAKLYMEYCPEGNLLDIIKKSQNAGSSLSEVLVWSALAQLTSALMYCHYGVCTSWDGSIPVSYPTEEWDPVIHRDIKPANVLVSSSTNDYILVKLGDFGLSKVMDNENAPASYAGTPQYQPPEIARSHPTGIRWTKKCDVFSLGCTLYQMCAWRSPFSYRMEESDVFDDIPELYSDRLRKCIAVCIAFRSEDRHDAFDLLRVVQRARNDPSTQHLAKAPLITAAGGELDSTGEFTSQAEEREEKLQPGKGESAGGGPVSSVASNVPALVKDSISQAHQPAEVAAAQGVVNNKRDVESELLREPPLYNSSGEKVLLDLAGADVTESFEDVGHSQEARETRPGLRVGRLRRTSSSSGGPKTTAANKTSPLRSSSVEGGASQTRSESDPPPRPRPADSKRTLPSLPATTYETPTQKYFCVLKGCSYSKRPGFLTYDALEMHVSTIHPKRYQDPETKAKLRQQEHLHSTIATPSPQANREHSRENTSIYGYDDRFFCDVQGCHYDANNFIGFTTKKLWNDHMENFDHSSMKRAVVRSVVDDRKQQAVREQMKRSAQLINQKFYCSDGNCPYSKDKFVGYGSRAECLGHIRSYHQQEPVENAHVDINEVDKIRRPQLENQKFYCSDWNCPYSRGKFVGYGSRAECLGHIRSYHKQEPVENTLVDVTGVDKSRMSQLLSILWHGRRQK